LGEVRLQSPDRLHDAITIVQGRRLYRTRMAARRCDDAGRAAKNAAVRLVCETNGYAQQPTPVSDVFGGAPRTGPQL